MGMIRNGKSRLWPKAINALLSASTIESAAEEAGISKRTLIRWMQEPEFRNLYSQAKGDVLRTAAGILTRKAGRAAEVLAEVFEGNPQAHQGARVQAARATFELALQSYELENLEERIRRLEQQNDAL